jgi:hypothetical protein
MLRVYRTLLTMHNHTNFKAIKGFMLKTGNDDEEH